MNSTEKNLLENSLRDLAARQPLCTTNIEQVISKLANNEPLLDADRRWLATALHGTAMILGPKSHALVLTLARLTGTEALLTQLSEEWLASRKLSQRVEVMPEGTPHTGKCESLWRPGLECPNAAEFIIRNKSNDGYAVMCGPHKDGFLEQYRGNDVTVETYKPEAEIVKPPR